MSEDESRRAANEEPGDEVEAHKHTKAANEEASDDARRGETPESDDVEAHGHHLRQVPKKA